MPLRPLLQTTFIKNLDANNYKAAADALPTRISEATKQPPICDLEKIVGRGKIVIFIKLELAKVNERISVSGNITPEQAEFIATQLVEMFPNESLADFKICFERGCIGQYGEIYRMDGIVLRKWVERYLDEKYQVIESELMKEKDEHYKKIHPETEKDWYKVWLDSVGEGNKIPEITTEEILSEGQVRRKKEVYTPSPDNVIEYKERLKKARTEYFKEHYPDAEPEEIEAYLAKFKEI